MGEEHAPAHGSQRCRVEAVVRHRALHICLRACGPCGVAVGAQFDAQGCCEITHARPRRLAQFCGGVAGAVRGTGLCAQARRPSASAGNSGTDDAGDHAYGRRRYQFALKIAKS